jgi:hypothetical protein
MEAAWLQAAVVLPLLFNVLSFRVFEPEKAAALRLLAILALAGLLATAARSITRPALLVGCFWTPLCANAAGLVAATALSTATSIDFWQSLLGSYHRQGGLLTLFAQVTLFAAVALGVRCSAQLDRLFAAVTLSSVGVAAYAISQRLGLDPLSWDATELGLDPLQRSTGTLGNPTFVAGYIAVAMFLTVAYSRGRRLAVPALVVQCGGMLATGSRGALVATAAGVMVFLLAQAVMHRARRAAAATMLVGCAAVTVFALLNIPSGPLEAIRDVRPWRQFAHVFESTDETSQVRSLIWGATHELMTRKTPIETVGGSADRYHTARLLFGYGPETLQITVPRVYPAELARLEPGALADRAHNDLVDAFATGGVVSLGLMAALIAGVVWTGCKALRMRRRSGIACTSAAVMAGVAAAGMGAFVGGAGLIIPVIGIAMIGGFAAMLGLLGAMRTEPAQPGSDTVVVAAILAAVTAHLVDAQMGVVTVASRTLFWILAGCLASLSTAARDSPLMSDSEDRQYTHGSDWLAVSVLVTLGFGIAPNLLNSATVWPGVAVLAGISAVVLAVGVFSGMFSWRRVPPVLMGSALVVAVFVFVARRVSSPPTVQDVDVVGTVSGLALPIVMYCAVLLTMVLLGASRERTQRVPMVAAALAATLVLWPVTSPLRADVLVHGARQFEARGYPTLALSLHETASQLMPHERQYRMAAAGAAQLAAVQQEDANARGRLFERAAALVRIDDAWEYDLQETFASARIYHAWAGLASDPLTRLQRGAQANAFYQRLVVLSPTHPPYWNGWAALALDVFGNPRLARTRLVRSRFLDPQRSDIDELLAEADRRLAGP